MHYELYVDSLFLVNFVMNLYLLILVNRGTLGTATPMRILIGSAFGAGCYLICLCVPGPIFLKLVPGFLIGSIGMLLISFSVKSIRMFFTLFEKMLEYSFFMGGALLFLGKYLVPSGAFARGGVRILGMGGIMFLLISKIIGKNRRNDHLCRAVLCRGTASMTVTALIDTGNSLVEPISGKPVSVIDEKIFQSLWDRGERLYRVIPYHSIGKKHGFMEGYLLPELRLEVQGIQRIYKDVYVAVSPEMISALDRGDEKTIKMIINPDLFQKEKSGGPGRRQNVRKNDIKSDNTGKNAI